LHPGAVAISAIALVSLVYLIHRVHNGKDFGERVRAKYEHAYQRCVGAGHTTDVCDERASEACANDPRLRNDLDTESSICYGFKP
jgi:hypothetical protein